ncbi:MAG: polyprenyl synthetase family protein, partial [Victivallaceae bacterium]|nr:polyprenyl synthetase family protein [Victivallaceae bacterium]
DDLPCMDNDDLRRGKPTCHKKFGEAIALLTGDALLTLSFEWLAKSKIKNPARKAELISALAEAAGHFGMIGGQTVDIEETGCSPGEEKLLFIHHHKTADLIKASVVIGGISGNADERQIKKLSNFGFNIGMAFQFIDDILDYTQTSDTMGKTAGKDQAAGKVTAVSVFGLEETTSRAEKYKTQALKILKETDFEKSVLADISCFITKRVF